MKNPEEDMQTIPWNPPTAYKVVVSMAGFLFIGALGATMFHLFDDDVVFDQTTTRIILGALFFVSVVMMIAASRMLKCPQCGMAPLKQDRKVRGEPIRFVCGSCHIRWETDRVCTKSPRDH
ncbi:MAG: hypothetical protein ACSHYF_05160 [Verrucomicrobiaceae bacterium]